MRWIALGMTMTLLSGTASGQHHEKHGNPEDLDAYIARMEEPSRAGWQKPDEVVRALGLRPGMVACDIGAGPGCFALRMAHAVGARLGLDAARTGSMLAHIRREVGDFEANDLRRLAAGIRVPALVLHDAGDREVPFAHGQAIAQAWPGARLVALRGVRHGGMLAADAVIEQVLMFLVGSPPAWARPRRSAA